MARLLTAGAESGLLSQCDYCDQTHTATAWEYGVTDTLPIPVPSPASGSQWGYECAATNLTQWKHTAATELFYRVRFFIAEATIGETIAFLHITDGSGLERYHTGNTNHDIGFVILADGTLRATREQNNGTTLADTAAGTILPATWHLLRIRLKVANSGGVVTVFLDDDMDTPVINFSGDTLSTINVTAGTETILGVQGSGNRTLIFDDIAVNDTAGTFNNTYPDDRGVIALIPDGMGTGTNDLSGTAEATNRHLNVDEIPADLVDYNYDNVIGQYDLYDMEDVTGEVPIAVEIWERTFYPSTASTFKIVHEYDGTEYRTAGLAPTEFTTYPPPTGVDGPWYRHIPLDSIPGTGAAWTRAALNVLQAGFEVATAQEMRLHQLIIETEVETPQTCTLTSEDGLLLVDASEENVQVLLEPAAIFGRIYYIKRIDNSSFTVTIDPAPLTIDGVLNELTLSAYDSVALTTDGSAWWRL